MSATRTRRRQATRTELEHPTRAPMRPRGTTRRDTRRMLATT